MVGLVGGEPLLHPEIDEMIKLASQRKMTVNVSTNGSLLGNDRIQSLLALPLGYINISLDAVDADEFMRLRGGSAEMYSKVKHNIAQLCKLRLETGSDVGVYISFVTDQVNLHRIPEFTDLGRSLGVDTVFCQSVLSYQCSEVTTGESILWNTSENQAFIQSIKTSDDIIVVPPVLVPLNEHDGCKCVSCVHPFKLLAVDGAGNLSPCCVIPPHPRFGNLMTNINAWHDNKILQDFRQEMLLDRDASEKICIHCWERYSLKE